MAAAQACRATAGQAAAEPCRTLRRPRVDARWPAARRGCDREGDHAGAGWACSNGRVSTPAGAIRRNRDRDRAYKQNWPAGRGAIMNLDTDYELEFAERRRAKTKGKRVPKPKQPVVKQSYESNADVQRWLREQALDDSVKPPFDPTLL